MRKALVLFAFVAVRLFTQALFAQIPLPEKPTAYVTDAANVLDDVRERALNEKLAQYERDTTRQVIVYVARALPRGYPIEEVATSAFNTWGIGQVEKNNGVILFLFLDDRASRIEVGKGLTDVLTDAKASEILVDLRPWLRKNDFTTAVEVGAERVLLTLNAPPSAAPEAVVSPIPQPRHATERTTFEGGRTPPEDDWVSILVGVAVPIILFIGVVILVVQVIRKIATPMTPTLLDPDWNRDRSDDRHYHDSWSSNSLSSSGSSSSSSSSFTGGGGSSSGGGASGSW